jgi:hypothetical protein
MYRKLFIDSSFWINLALKGEPHHEEAVDFFKISINEGRALFTSNDVVDETVTRLFYRSGFRIAKDFYEIFQDNVRRGLLTQLWTDEQLQVEAWEILKKFREHKLSLTDATSVALIERFRLDAITSFDQDFKKIGITTLP